MIAITEEYKIAKLVLRKLKYIAQFILTQENRSETELSVLFTDNKRITELNRIYFKKDRPTDVIAFPQEDKKVLGDIVISVETAEQQAEELTHSLADELVYLLIHGILHLLGYDDIQPSARRKMRAKERAYLTKFYITAHPEKR